MHWFADTNRIATYSIITGGVLSSEKLSEIEEVVTGCEITRNLQSSSLTLIYNVKLKSGATYRLAKYKAPGELTMIGALEKVARSIPSSVKRRPYFRTLGQKPYESRCLDHYAEQLGGGRDGLGRLWQILRY